ncbi:MAG: SUMF1/EgtB/PvdO family nonheme iron enzyme [Planctomycetaceae bacterium]|nr:SUMF1/EgtB/PvdO family nonheme iron enzyme [Planctomycetaceae bacterium]
MGVRRCGFAAFSIIMAFLMTSQRSLGQSTFSDEWTAPASLYALPSSLSLPHLLTFADGRPVESPADWKRRREELKSMLLYYQYGNMPARPEKVSVVESRRRPHESGLGDIEFVTLEIDNVKQLRFRAAFYLPKHNGRRPVIIREEDRIGQRKDVPMFLEKGYIFVEYARHDLDPDRDRWVGVAQAAYPNHDWATLAVWAWCGMRLIDYLETRDDIDMGRIAITGHSRGGKMALLTGALDERIRLVVPHQSGSGGAGCYRLLGPGAETLAQNDKPHWYHERIRWFGKQEERLPFDQHFLKALVAPRCLLCTESIDDEFANPLGSLVTTVAAQPAFELLGASGNNAIHFRRGRHSTERSDWARILEFAEWKFFGNMPADQASYWTATFPLPDDFAAFNEQRPLWPQPNEPKQGNWIVPAPTKQPYEMVTVGSPGNEPDRDLHGQGRFGAVDQPFQIATHEVSHVDYARFLNAVAREDPAGLYHPRMETAAGAIRRVKNQSSYQYQVMRGQLPIPVSYVSWLDAVRYCNWLHHGRPSGEQGVGTTEDGAYQLAGVKRVGSRQIGAKYALPTENEWYKAAYYALKPDGAGSYLHFASNQSNRPRIDRPQPDLLSPWGMAGFANRVWEWTESPVGQLHHAIRSAAWYLGNNKQSAGRFYSHPQIEDARIGFRMVRLVPN